MVLYEDLKKGNLDTLSKYVVEWKHVSCDENTHLILNDLEKYLIHQMCKKILMELSCNALENIGMMMKNQEQHNCTNILNINVKTFLTITWSLNNTYLN